MNEAVLQSRSIAYCKGFVDGYDSGIDNNPYDGHGDSKNHLLYRIGYDAGVAEYCNANHPEE
jgi:hypothetical protein